MNRDEVFENIMVYATVLDLAFTKSSPVTNRRPPAANQVFVNRRLVSANALHFQNFSLGVDYEESD